MPGKIIDLAGDRFGRLIVLKPIYRSKRGIIWQCVCDCGNQTKVSCGALRYKDTKSCGCLALEILKTNSIKHGHTSDGDESPTYNSWRNMKRRCSRVKNVNYKYYGGKGIKVCDRWKNFENFLKDMGERPIGKTLDRIDANGDYELSNCRWATWKEQNDRKRRQK